MKNAEDSSLKINVRLFRKVQKAIRKEAGAFEMDWWADTDDDKPKSKEHPCFTTACMAGWAVFEDRGRLPKHRISTWDWQNGRAVKRMVVNEEIIPKKAIAALGITARQGGILFAKAAWPSEMQERLRDGYTSEKNRNGKSDAENACALIDRFLANRGAIDWRPRKDRIIDSSAFE